MKREPIKRKKPKEPWSAKSQVPRACVSKKFIGQKIVVRESSGSKFSGTILETTASHISIHHNIKGFRMFPCEAVEILSVKKKGGCGCRGKR